MTRRQSLPGPVPGDVESALDELGIQYIVRDNEAWARCPAPDHRDRKASWSCNLVTGEHNCFSCHIGGTFVSLVAMVMGTEWAEALRWVRKRGGMERARAVLSGKPGEAVSIPERRMTEADLALFWWPPAEALEARRISQTAVQQYEMLWDTERGMFIIPVRDPYSRRLRGWQEKSADLFKNVPWGLEKADCLYGLHTLRKGSKRVILVESPLDCLRIFCAGVNGAIASYGAEVSERQLEVIGDLFPEMICALDDDDAGWRRAEWIKDNRPRSLRVKYFDYDAAWAGNRGKRKDPGDMTDEEIRRGIDGAYSSLIARF